jgi:hypothetical protein
MHFDDGSNPWIHSENYVQVFKFGSSGSAGLGNIAGSLIMFLIYSIYMHVVLTG